MHILQIYKDYPPVFGGIENHLKLVAEGLVARGHQVTVLISARGRRDEVYHEGGVRIVAAGRLASAASTPLSPSLPLLLARERPDVIHLHHPYPPGDAVTLLVARRTPLVVTYHSDIVRQRVLGAVVRPLVRATLRRAARIVATSPAYIRSSPMLAPVASRCRVVPSCPPLAYFEQPDPAMVAELQARYPGPVVLFVGRLRYYKGADRLVRAMADVPARAVFVGGDASVRAADLAALAAGLGLGERVHFAGEQSDAWLRAFYRAATVFALPSVERSEAFGLSQVEAQAAGLPIVCTELGTGTSYVTRHGQTGIVVPPDDVPALARALRILVENPPLARAFGEAGRARARAEFHLETMLDRLEAVYDEALRGD